MLRDFKRRDAGMLSPRGIHSRVQRPGSCPLDDPCAKQFLNEIIELQYCNSSQTVT